MRRSFFHPQQPAQTKGWATYKGKIDGLHTWEINGQTYKSSVSTVGASPQVGVQYPALCKQPNSSSQWVALTGRPKEFLIPYQGGAPASTYLWATALGKPGGLYNVNNQGGTDFKDGEENHNLQGHIYRTTPTHLIACNGTKFWRYSSLAAQPEEFDLGEEFDDYILNFSLTSDGKILAYLSYNQKIACYEWGNKIPLWAYTPGGGKTPDVGDAVELGDKIYVPLRDSGNNLQYGCLSSGGQTLWESSNNWLSRPAALPAAEYGETIYYDLTQQAWDNFRFGHQQDRAGPNRIRNELAATDTQLIPRVQAAEYVPVINKSDGTKAWELKGWLDINDSPSEKNGDYSYLEFYTLACTFGDLSLFFVTRLGWWFAPEWEQPIIEWRTQYALPSDDVDLLDQDSLDAGFSTFRSILGDHNNSHTSFLVFASENIDSFASSGLASLSDEIENSEDTELKGKAWNFCSAEHEFRQYSSSGAKIKSTPPTDQEKIVDGSANGAPKFTYYNCPKGKPLGYVKETWHYKRTKPNPFRDDDSDPFTWKSLSQEWSIEDHTDPAPIPSGKMPVVQFFTSRQKGYAATVSPDAILPGTPTSAPHHGVAGTQNPDGTWTDDGAILIKAPYINGTSIIEMPMTAYGYDTRAAAIYTSSDVLRNSGFDTVAMRADTPLRTENQSIFISVFADPANKGYWDYDVEYPADKFDFDCTFYAEEVWATAYTFYYDYIKIPIKVDAWPPYNPTDGAIIDGRLILGPGKANIMRGAPPVGH